MKRITQKALIGCMVSVVAIANAHAEPLPNLDERLLLDGRWQCTSVMNDEVMEMSLTSTEAIFALTKTYETESVTVFHYHGEEIAKLKIKEFGKFSLNEQVISFQLDNLVIETLLDKHNLYDDIEVEKLRQAMLSDVNNYKILQLTAQKWVVEEEKNKQQVSCIRPDRD